MSVLKFFLRSVARTVQGSTYEQPTFLSYAPKPTILSTTPTIETHKEPCIHSIQNMNNHSVPHLNTTSVPCSHPLDSGLLEEKSDQFSLHMRCDSLTTPLFTLRSQHASLLKSMRNTVQGMKSDIHLLSQIHPPVGEINTPLSSIIEQIDKSLSSFEELTYRSTNRVCEYNSDVTTTEIPSKDHLSQWFFSSRN